MSERIVINPLTRISGFMKVDVTIENNIVIDARTSGLLFRGFEKMLVGRSPFDAVYFTQRICGICSTAHSIASTLALEDAMRITPSEQGRYLRDVIHGCEFLQNHIRHFYQYTIPDFVKLPEKFPLYETNHEDFRLPEKINNSIAEHYFKSLEFSRSAHEMLAVLGGKAPHNHGIFIGGITSQATTDKIIQIKSILSEITQFIENTMIPDVFIIAKYYGEYFKLGGGCGNLLSYGCFDNYEALGTLYVNPSVYVNGKTARFDPDSITEKIDYSWYKGMSTYKPEETVSDADMGGNKAYSWIKAPRYNGIPFEVGPLARQMLSGEYKNGISMMDRTIARVYEARKIAKVMDTLLQNIIPNVSIQNEYVLPQTSQGKGLIDTTRGALGHWLKIRNEAISFYQIITPSAWNFSTCDDSFRGTAEQALIGTPIQDPSNPVEIGRILRSFDPCVSCATHMYIPGYKPKIIQVMP